MLYSSHRITTKNNGYLTKMSTEITNTFANNTPQIKQTSFAVPPLISQSGERAYHKFVEYFIGQIRNANTREAYARAIKKFLNYCEEQGAKTLTDISYIMVAGYIEWHPSSPPTRLQHLSAIRQLFDWLVKQNIVKENPAKHVKGPKYRLKIGKTPVLETEEMRQLFNSFETYLLLDLRDRALIGLMTYSFARISATLAMKREDYFCKNSRHYARLHEKGGKYMEVPLHHNAHEYLHSYIAAAEQQRAWTKEMPLFPSQQRGRPNILSNQPLKREEAYVMIKRRAKEAGITTAICNHTFRGTGITNYLENGGTRDIAQELAGHEDVRTTALYDRRASKISLDEIERMRF